MIHKFGSVGSCPKCGGNTSNCVKRSFRNPMSKSDVAKSELYRGLDLEYMVVQCQGCGYSWYERPRDFVEPAPDAYRLGFKDGEEGYAPQNNTLDYIKGHMAGQQKRITTLAKREVDAIAPEGATDNEFFHD